jgi:hypothetical protein
MPETIDKSLQYNELITNMREVFNSRGATDSKDTIDYSYYRALQSFWGTYKSWVQMQLPEFCEEYFKKALKNYITKENGTDKWLVTFEFEGIADDACIEFCNTHGLISDLRKCINEAKYMFSNMQRLVTEYDCYPIDEYEEEGHIVIRVEVDSDQNTAFREYDKFIGWMLNEIADDNLGFFVLTVNRIE